jgi:hypothetical protein
MAENMKIEVPGVDINAIAQQVIAAKVTEAMLGANLGPIVAAAMMRNVDQNGAETRYNGRPFVEWVAEDVIRKATIAAVQAKVKEMAPALEAAIVKELKGSASLSAKVIVAAFVGAAERGWGIEAHVGLKDKSR